MIGDPLQDREGPVELLKSQKAYDLVIKGHPGETDLAIGPGLQVITMTVCATNYKNKAFGPCIHGLLKMLSELAGSKFTPFFIEQPYGVRGFDFTQQRSGFLLFLALRILLTLYANLRDAFHLKGKVSLQAVFKI